MSSLPKSRAMAAVHETMRGLHTAGAIDKARMQQFDELCLEPSGKVQQRAAARLIFVLFKDAHGDWRWNLEAANGKIVASSGEGYRRKRDCLSAIELVRASATAEVAA